MLPILLLLAAFASHVLPHPWWNFTAVGGALLVWGARQPSRWFLASAVLPVALLATGDYYLTKVVYGYPFHVGAYLLTWAWYGLSAAAGQAWFSARCRFGFPGVDFFLPGEQLRRVGDTRLVVSTLHSRA